MGVVFATAGHYVFVTETGEVLAFAGLDVPPRGGTLRGTFSLTSAHVQPQRDLVRVHVK